MSLQVRHESETDRFSVYDADGALQGWVVYDVSGDTMRLLHAEVPPFLRGKGVGAEVVRSVLDELRASRTERIQPICGFVRSWMRDHPDYADLTTR